MDMPSSRPAPIMTPDQREDYEERAAIMQYDGGLSREQAEAEAEAWRIVTEGAK